MVRPIQTTSLVKIIVFVAVPFEDADHPESLFTSPLLVQNFLKKIFKRRIVTDNLRDTQM